MIFDEPTTALDVTTQIEVLRAFKSVVRERRHDGRLCLARPRGRRADRRPHRRAARRRASSELGPTGHILAAPQHHYTQSLLAAAAPGAARRGRPGRRRATPAAARGDGLIAGYGPRGRDGLPARSPVLHDVSLRLERGQTLGVIGESGWGKSTLARVIAGPVAPAMPAASGSTAARWPPASRGRSRDQLRRIQIVFQIGRHRAEPGPHDRATSSAGRSPSITA